MLSRDWKILGGLLLLLAFIRKRSSAVWGDGWHFPVPDMLFLQGAKLVEFPAVITSGFRGDRPDHNGVDIMYSATPQKPQPGVLVKTGTDGWNNHDGRGHWAPEGTPVLAAKTGRIWSTGKTAHGIGIVIDHGKPWATFYQHLASTHLAPHAAGKEIGTGKVTTVRAGEVIGKMGASSLDGAKLRHLHFEAWFNGVGADAAQDPEPEVKNWARSSWRWP